MALLKKLNVDVLTGCRRPHVVLVDSEEWAADDDLRHLPSLDILLAFEDYTRVRERIFEDHMWQEHPLHKIPLRGPVMCNKVGLGEANLHNRNTRKSHRLVQWLSTLY